MDWEKWIAEQEEAVRKAFDEHVAGLKSALQKERDGNVTLKKQVDELGSKSADAESTKQTLTELQAKLAETAGDADATKKALESATTELMATRRERAFYKEAQAQGVVNPENAYLIAAGKKLLDDEGNVDWVGFKTAAPEAFRAAGTSPGNPERGRTLTMDDVRKMTPAEYEKNRDAVNAVLAAGG